MSSGAARRRKTKVNARHSIEYGIAVLTSAKRFFADNDNEHQIVDALIFRLLEDRDVAYNKLRETRCCLRFERHGKHSELCHTRTTNAWK
jgi:hypothetical protein